jgi:hypothetical protein
MLNDEDTELQIVCRIASVVVQNRKGKSSVVPNASLSVIVYGALDLFESIGDLFEKNDLFLQDPIGCDRAVEYRNPHRLSGLDHEAPMTSVEEVTTTLQQDYASGTVDILSGFETGEYLIEARDPSALHTPLQR